jgi:hypothetical protein
MLYLNSLAGCEGLMRSHKKGMQTAKYAKYAENFLQFVFLSAYSAYSAVAFACLSVLQSSLRDRRGGIDRPISGDTDHAGPQQAGTERGFRKILISKIVWTLLRTGMSARLRRPHRITDFLRASAFGFRISAAWLLASSAAAQNLQPPPIQIPALQPPRGEIPLTFWEQHGVLVVMAGVIMLAVIGAVVWLLTRPKPRAAVPPATAARQELNSLQHQPEDGAVLSRVSQVLRRYVIAAFGLPSGELTTAEFCRVVGGQEQVGPELAESLGGFLRQCDERKFAPAQAPTATPLSATSRALELIEQAEARLTEARCESQENAPQPKRLGGTE